MSRVLDGILTMTTSSLTRPEVATEQPSQLTKTPYQADQQVKYMYLQAEIDCLLEELKNIKRQRESVHC